MWTSHFAAFEKNLIHICRRGLEPGLMRNSLAINYTTTVWTRLSRLQLNCIGHCGQVWSYTLQSSCFFFLFLIMVYTFFFLLNMLLHVSAVVEKVYEMNWRYLAVPVPNVWYNTVEVADLHTTWLQTQVFSTLCISSVYSFNPTTILVLERIFHLYFRFPYHILLIYFFFPMIILGECKVQLQVDFHFSPDETIW